MSTVPTVSFIVWRVDVIMKEFWEMVKRWDPLEQQFILGGLSLAFLASVCFIAYWLFQLIAVIHGVTL